MTSYSEFLFLQDIDEKDLGVLCVHQLEYNKSKPYTKLHCRSYLFLGGEHSLKTSVEELEPGC